jgi:hypothetical protein
LILWTVRLFSFHGKDAAQPGTYAAPDDTSRAGIPGIDGATVADLNGDGRPDVAVVGFFPVGSPSTVQSRLNLFTQSGGGTFALTGGFTLLSS